MCYVILQFITTYETDSNVRKILERFDWYIIPVLNPDGYEYSHTVVGSELSTDICDPII